MVMLLVILTVISLNVSAEGTRNGTNLSDWEYTETDDTIILTKYIGTSTDVIVPGSFTEKSGMKVKLNSLEAASSVFKDCKYESGLISITSLKIGIPEQKVGIVDEDMSSAFAAWINLNSIDLQGLDTGNVTNMENMFSYSGLTNLKLNSFDTSKVIIMKNMFANCNMLTNLDVSSFDTSNVINMSSMFKGCYKLTSLDVSGFDTSHVTNMNSMFNGCSSLTSLDVSKFNTSRVTSMRYMFDGCQNVSNLDVSHFDTQNVTDIYSMFNNCLNVHYFDLSGWDLSSANIPKYNYIFGTSMSTGCITTIVKCSDLNEAKLKEVCGVSILLANRKKPNYPKYDANGGIYEDGLTSKQYFDSYAINISKFPTVQKKLYECHDAPKKADKIFDAWYLEPECTIKYANDNTPIDMNKVIEEGLTLYAGWRDPEVSYEFVSGTSGKELSEEVTQLLPGSVTCTMGNKIEPIDLAQTTVSTPDGNWSFIGYDTNEKEVTGDTTFIGTWIYNSAPMITANDKTIVVGDTFNPSEGMSAIDEEDGDLTGNVQIIANNVNPNKEGAYQVTYQVTDSGGITVTKKMSVTVSKKGKPIDSDSSNNKSNIIVDINHSLNSYETVDNNKIKTGDNTDIMMWLVLIVLSNGCIVWMNRKKYKLV